jgi:multidrug resistance efflux pump
LIVAALEALVALGAIHAHNTVTATRQDTVCEATVSVVIVAVIARLESVVAKHQVRTGDLVAAGCKGAAVGAPIPVNRVAVIAEFTLFKGRIAATRLDLSHDHLFGTGQRD